MLYLLQVNEWAKVGYTTDRDTLETRMNHYGTHCPGVQLLGVRDGTKEDEHKYHTSFDQYEDWGEWRKVPKNVLDTIKGDFTPVGIQMKPGTRKLTKKEKEYRNTHKEELKACRNSHKEEKAAYDKQYYEAHKEERKATMKVYFEAHKEELRAKAREHWKKKHSKNI